MRLAMKTGRTAAVVLFVVACVPVNAAAQADEAGPKSAIKRWSISLGAAAQVGGPASQYEAAMKSAGFGDTFPGSATYPFSTQFLLWEGNVTYLRNDRLALGLVVGRGDLGETFGNKKDLLRLSLDSDVTVLAPVAYLRLGENARVGAGPVVAWTRVSDTSKQRGSSYTSVKGGAMAHAALESSPRRRICFALNVSYRWIAPAKVGPFVATFVNSTATLPSMNINLSYASVGVSLGLRF